MPPIVVWLSQITQQLLDLVPEHDPRSPSTFYSQLSLVIITVGTSILAFLIGWVRQAIPKVDAWMFPTHGAVDFAYLLDPLYAATSRGAFEKRLLEAGDRRRKPSICA